MELHQLRYFTALARLGNFTRAAEACHVAQPTLSQQIAKLEHELGESLFERGHRGVTLTAVGQSLLEKVEHALHLLDEAKESVQTASKVQRLSVAAIPTVAPYLLPETLVEFARTHPHVRVEVKELTTAECLSHLTAGELDLAILALPVRAEQLATQTLFTEELLLAMPVKHRLAKKPQIRLKELADEPFVILHEAHCLSGQAMSFCARHALSPLVTAQLHQLSTVLELVRLGLGLSFIPQMATTAFAHPDLVFRSLSGDQPSRTLAVAWSKLRLRHLAMQPFLATLGCPAPPP